MYASTCIHHDLIERGNLFWKLDIHLHYYPPVDTKLIISK